jgi:peroxiredoxin
VRRRELIPALAVAGVAAAAGAWVGARMSGRWRGAPVESQAVAQAEAARESAAAALLGRPRPEFTHGATDGRLVSAGDFDGRVLLMNFWATWCEPCREEMPMLDALQGEYAGEGLAVVGVALDDVQRARGFVERLGLSYTVLVGAGDVLETSRAWGNAAGLLPYSVLVDRQGTVRWTHFGELRRQELVARLEELL